MVVGQHQGYPYYTAGQRKGLGIALGRPIFVTEILPESNTVVLGDEHELQRHEAYVKNVNLVKYASIAQPMEAVTKIRYKDAGMSRPIVQQGRSEERRDGKEGVSTCRTRWSPNHKKTKKHN